MQHTKPDLALYNPGLSTTLVWLSILEQLEHAAQSAEKGLLPDEALELISGIRQGFVGEAREVYDSNQARSLHKVWSALSSSRLRNIQSSRSTSLKEASVKRLSTGRFIRQMTLFSASNEA